MSNKFFTQRFELDTPISRYQQRGLANYVGPFKSFWVSKTNNSSFQASLVPDGSDDSGSGIPLRMNQCQTFETKPTRACIEVPVAQPGMWIEITFSQDEMIQVGSILVESSGAVIVSGGSSFDNDKYSVTDAAAQLLPANDQRSSSEIYNQTDEAIFVGTQAKISDADFMNTCVKIRPGNEIPFVWDLPAALYARKEVAGTVYPVILNKVK